jgi:ABC-2 type transport system ATP-binding protein
LTVKDADNAAKATQIIERILDARVHLAEASELIAPIDNTDKLTDVLTTLKDAGIALSGVNILQPTLDEVFLALTGEGSKDKKEEN